MSVDDGRAPDERAPLLRVVRGVPTADELAALVAVVAGRAAGQSPPAAAPLARRWGRPVLRGMPAPGRGAWQASGLPDA